MYIFSIKSKEKKRREEEKNTEGERKSQIVFRLPSPPLSFQASCCNSLNALVGISLIKFKGNLCWCILIPPFSALKHLKSQTVLIKYLTFSIFPLSRIIIKLIFSLLFLLIYTHTHISTNHGIISIYSVKRALFSNFSII